VAAQRFLETNELPTSYVDQVVQFIEKNTSAENLGNSEFMDPFTGDLPFSLQSCLVLTWSVGASRYRGSASSAPAAASTYSDPYTGTSRYVAGASVPSAPSPSSGDPFTGASRYTGPPSQQAPNSQSQKAILPVVSHCAPFFHPKLC